MKKNPFQICILFLLLICTLPLSARADNPRNEVFQGGEIVVSSHRPVIEQVSTVRTVTESEIRKMGATTLDEAINLLPGINIRVGGDGTPRIDLRGFVTRHIKLLINGVPFNSTYDGQFDPTLIPVESIAEIKLISGGASMLYGDGDLAGVINIITKKGYGPPHLDNAGAETGTDGFNRLYGSVAGSKGRGSYYLSASESGREGEPVSSNNDYTFGKTGGLISNSDRLRKNLYGNFGYHVSSKTAIDLTFTHIEGHNGLALPGIDNKNDPFAPTVKYERLDHIVGNTVQLTGDFKPAHRLSMRSWLYFNTLTEDDNSYDNANYDTVSNPSLKNTFLTHNTTHIPGAHIQLSYHAISSGTLSLAADSRIEYWNQTGLLHNVPLGGGGGGGGGHGGGGGGTYTSQNINLAREIGIQSLDLEYSVHPLPKLSLVAGVGQYWQRLDNDSHRNAHGYLLGSSYQWLPRTRLRASFSRHIRFPEIQQLYNATSGDPGLLPESALNTEIGIDHQILSGTTVGLTLFHDDVHNYIEKNNTTNFYQNYDHYLFQGIEFSGKTRYFKRLELTGTYTYLQSENKSYAASSNLLQYRPRHKLDLSADYRFNHGYSAFMSMLFIANQEYFSNSNPTQNGQLNGYTLFNIKLNKHIEATHLTLYVGANNLFDKNYETSYGFPQAGRVIYTGIEYGL